MADLAFLDVGCVVRMWAPVTPDVIGRGGGSQLLRVGWSIVCFVGVKCHFHTAVDVDLIN